MGIYVKELAVFWSASFPGSFPAKGKLPGNEAAFGCRYFRGTKLVRLQKTFRDRASFFPK